MKLYAIALIEGLEPHGFQTEVWANSFEDAAEKVRAIFPEVCGFPADVKNVYDGMERKILL